MIISTFMAASLALTPVEQEVPAPVHKQAQIITTILIACRPVIDPVYWDRWLPISRDLGITDEYISNVRILVARDPYPVTEPECEEALISSLQKLQRLRPANTDN